MTSERDGRGGPHHDLVEAIALIDAAASRLHSLGGEQEMSVGPALADVETLRETALRQAKGYGVVSEDTPLAELRHEARTEVNVEVLSSDGE
ncbi:MULTISPECIES: hypothetical protein [Halobacterium]|uniref:hypothetical protein n=1 Tax=Halobacterium TaxID=2239 RepID=UPI000A4E0D1F|nr:MULTISPECIES: hypothetical protein [Halobacterium]MCG1002842.1 hypothetical protein [Halobacterium noricense]